MTPAPKLSVGLLLTAAAGFIDAIGFIELGGFYTSFMSGNTTQLGDALANGIWPTALLTTSLVLLFFLGSVAGSALALTDRRWGPVGALALVLLALSTAFALTLAGYPPPQTMLALAVAAGAQNAVLLSEGSVRLGATFVTGTLFAAGQDLARALRREAPPWRWAQHLLVWASLLAGAALGALGYRAMDIYALALPLAVYAAFLLGFVLLGPRAVKL
ncbi:MAG: hypothetical protein JWR51_1785 [Devosia sp.]|uniref:YoaK family protein n=1 Tax=Devosia sp. TaxID=1871048 RepID=UPI00261E732B|nr:DUF1275 family protein [Devosia sp.]MDB5528682.1 hypothetical protein [Devosia sp.]